MANPYSEDTTKKFNSMELLVPRTGTIHHLCKLPQSLYMPGQATHTEAFSRFGEGLLIENDA